MSRGARLGLAGAVLTTLGACNNTYGPPPAGAGPENYGQQHYIDNQRYQQMTQDRMNLPD